MKKITSFIITVLFSILSIEQIFSQSHISTQAHQEAISAIVPSSDENSIDKSYFSIGKDGFLVKWTSDDQGEHYQITELEIKLAAVSPSGKEIAVYETDGGTINRLSIWNWDTLTKKISRRFSDSITSLSYTEKGTYIIVGTATVDGAVFIRASDGGVVEKIPGKTGIISYAKTSSTEKTAVMYSPAGNLSYYNLNGGRLINKIPVMQGMEQTVLFNNYLFLAGVKDGNIYVSYAVPGYSISGHVIFSEKAQNPILLASKNDKNLYYLENDLKGTYTLKMLENQENKAVSKPRIVKTFKGPKGNSSIICGTKLGNELMFGTRSGAIYKASAEPETNAVAMRLLTSDEDEKILDMAPYEEDFYFLTKNDLYRSSFDTGIVNRLGSNSGQTQLIPYGNKVILWSKGTRESVQLYDYSKPETTTLFVPKTSLQSVRLFGNKLVEMESNSVINVFDMETKKLTEVYTGAGLQDAIIAENGKLYVAKSYATNPHSSLLCIDMVTKETVPTPLPGNVAFALNSRGNDIYGITISTENNLKATKVIKYNTVSNQTVTILRLADEDSDAFTYLKYPILYTNIGKDSVKSYNLSTSKRFTFKRSASLPLKICENSNRVVILNRDGSISWYNRDLPQYLADWYLTKQGEWYEY